MKAIIQPEAGLTPVVQAVRRARSNVEISIFRMDRKELEEALAGAVARGVKVRAMIAHTNRGGEARLRKLEQRLIAAGVMVSRTGDEFVRYHGKYLIADNTLYVFGFNFTKNDIAKSRSFGIATRDTRTVKEAAKLFECDVLRQPYMPSRSNLVVSPETARDVLGRFLAGAKRELAIYDVKVQDPEMIRILKDRARRGVRIRILGTMKGSIEGAQVLKLQNMRLHVRAIVRDGTGAFVGSQSLRKLELDKRREVGVLINNPAVTRQLLAVFESDWVAAGGKTVAEAAKAAS